MLDFIIPFFSIAIAELGDRTQLAILMLSCRQKNHFPLLLGVVTAFLLVDGFAVIFGASIIKIIPIVWLKMISGLIFIIFGIITLKSHDREINDRLYSSGPFISGFVMVSMMEWGDKTQIATALFAIKYNPYLVLAGTVLSLTMLSVIAIYLGRIIADKFNKELLSKVTGIMFLILGVIFMIF